MYLARRTALQQFKFVDPFIADFYSDAKPFNHLLLDKNKIFMTQVSGVLCLIAFLYIMEVLAF